MNVGSACRDNGFSGPPQDAVSRLENYRRQAESETVHVFRNLFDLDREHFRQCNYRNPGDLQTVGDPGWDVLYAWRSAVPPTELIEILRVTASRAAYEAYCQTYSGQETFTERDYYLSK